MKAYIKLMRPKHCIKNMLIFVPLFFSNNLFDLYIFTRVLVGMIAFSLSASMVYIVNDIKDADRDRQHPVKCKRPIACGEVSVKNAKVLAAFCIVISVFLLLAIGKSISCIYIIIYVLLNILYSYGLKNIPLVDIVILVSGFLIRVLFGAHLANVEISGWLYLTVIAISFYLGLGKRRNELKKNKYFLETCNVNRETRGVLKFYTYEFLDKNMYMCMGLANTFYALWAMENNNKYMLWTVPIVLVISMKYSLTIEGNSDGDPVEVILHDKLIIFLVVIYIICLFFMLYV